MSAEQSAGLQQVASCPEVQKIHTILGPHAHLHLVGGTVRDVVGEKISHDIDLACALTALDSKRLLEDNGIRVIETGLKHGTLTVVINGKNIELTAFRAGTIMRADHAAGSIEVDLAARDFTINAIAYEVATHTLVDPYNGVADLAANRLRAVGDASARFHEDPLRILRMIRFGPASKRFVEPSTIDAARAQVQQLTSISVERKRTELEKILLSKGTREAFTMMLDLGILADLLPEILPSVNFEQNEFHSEDVFEHTLSVIENTPAELVLRLTALFHDIEKPASFSVGDDGRRHFYKHEVAGAVTAKKVMERLRFSHEQIAQVCTLVALHMRPLDCGDAGTRRLMRELGALLEVWKTFKQADVTPKMNLGELHGQLQQFSARVQQEKARTKGSVYGALAVDGYDLISLGVAPGPFLGRLLRHLEELVIENPDINERETLIAAARSYIEQGESV